MERDLEYELETELEGGLVESEFTGESAVDTETEPEEELVGEMEGDTESVLNPELINESSEFETPDLESALESEFGGDSEYETEGSGELDELGGGGLHELGDYEQEEFFNRAFRGIRRFVRRAAPALKRIGRIAAPMVSKAVGTYFGGPAGAMLSSKLGNLVASQLKELEMEIESELETQEVAAESVISEQELEYELQESADRELTEHEQLNELMAHNAAQSGSEAEAEALIGAAATMALSARDRAALRRLVPDLVRGAAVLTRVLRLRPTTKPMIRAVPLIVRSTTRMLRRGALQGRPVTRRGAATIMARQTRRVLSSPRICARVLSRNVRSVQRLARPSRTASRASQSARSRRMREI